MPKFFTLCVGIAAAGAITYKFRNDMVQDQINIKNRLNDAKSTLEEAVAEEQYKRVPSYLSDSQKYVSHRLVPSVKDSWNSQIMNAAQSLVKVDIGSKLKSAWDQHVVKNVSDIVNNK